MHDSFTKGEQENARHARQSHMLMKASLLRMRKAVHLNGIYPHARQDFANFLAYLEKVNSIHNFANHRAIKRKGFGQSKGEIEYRKWALANRLFLHFLNDIDSKTAQSAGDKATLPALVRPILETSSHFEGLFNQIKQEFVSARFMFFDGVSAKYVHYSDKGVFLYNTLDYPAYSLSVEKIKTAFRLSYSTLDKIAFFLNEYLSLGIKHHQVNFRTFWYKDRKRENGLRDEFSSRENWALRGLFWLSKDLFEDGAFTDAIEPAAQELADIRNHLEHKYLKVHLWEKPQDNFKQDALAYSIGRNELSTKTMQIMKIARSSLIYFILTVNKEEQERSKNKLSKIVEIEIDTFEDEWKF